MTYIRTRTIRYSARANEFDEKAGWKALAPPWPLRLGISTVTSFSSCPFTTPIPVFRLIKQHVGLVVTVVALRSE
jgi:hypothetical protein